MYLYESYNSGWFVGIIVALALLCIGYLVFSANSPPSGEAPAILEYRTELLIVDNITGCHYVDGASTTPRLDTDGKHVCRPVK